MRSRTTARMVLGVVALMSAVLAVDLAVVATRQDEPRPSEVAAVVRPVPIEEIVPTDAPTTTTVAPTTTVTTPPTSAAPAAVPRPSTTTTSRPETPSVASASTGRGGPWTLGPYRGVGVWLDVYDWTNELTGGRPQVELTDIDQMAQHGIQTLFIQTGHRRSTSDVIEPGRLKRFIDRAHARGIAVVAWYLPSLEDVNTDLRRLVAASRLPVDGLGVDIESRAVADPAERTRRLLDLSARLRQAVGKRAVAAITPSAVHLQVVNPGFWPGFPWRELAQRYDAILPMAYWTIRSPEWRSGERYIGEDIDRIRASTGRTDIPIHVIGGIADGATVPDVQGMVRAIKARGVLGGSLYDWKTSNPAQWVALRPLRAS